jgi:hypothetical protein
MSNGLINPRRGFPTEKDCSSGPVRGAARVLQWAARPVASLLHALNPMLRRAHLVLHRRKNFGIAVRQLGFDLFHSPTLSGLTDSNLSQQIKLQGRG